MGACVYVDGHCVVQQHWVHQPPKPTVYEMEPPNPLVKLRPAPPDDSVGRAEGAKEKA